MGTGHDYPPDDVMADFGKIHKTHIAWDQWEEVDDNTPEFLTLMDPDLGLPYTAWEGTDQAGRRYRIRQWWGDGQDSDQYIYDLISQPNIMPTIEI